MCEFWILSAFLLKVKMMESESHFLNNLMFFNVQKERKNIQRAKKICAIYGDGSIADA